MANRSIRTIGYGCSCGSNEFHFEYYGADGGCCTWLAASCKKCCKSYELDSSPDSYEFYLTEEEKQKIIESAMNNARASMSLEGIYISDTNFAKIKAIASELEQII
ncbi:hypothetical protein HWD22_gp140 [Salmonella phage bombadil]|uniref:Uncharacterized protein n=3 Tax=Epseptimavirus TaxID=2732017 RepID=A0A7G8AP02_9CAUD|nr:hypothetical protein HWD22_gp140 [Salmonella phage bombadil]QIN99511.1 hypothetical protein bombadil_112 [Salmonella phage bombadil]QNI21854.1 hypothetical protein [Salmonella phage 8sent65]QQV89318.1 hypothetical protein vBSTyj51_49 [Salmonella phage vB STyj5-1]